MSVIGTIVSIATAAGEVVRGGYEIYKLTRAGQDYMIVRAPRGLAARAKAEAERRQKKGARR